MRLEEHLVITRATCTDKLLCFHEYLQIIYSVLVGDDIHHHSIFILRRVVVDGICGYLPYSNAFL